MIPETISQRLKAFFPENELEWRVQQAGMSKTTGKPYAMVLCYVQARAVENRLDSVLGFENWQNGIRVEGENIIARLGVKIAGEWIWKENGASQTEIEAFKGGISGAFKRVASSGFGIGRYLYELDTTFAECTTDKPSNMSGWNKATCKDDSGKRTTFYWQTPRLPEKFLPNGDDRFFSENESKSAKDWADSINPGALETALSVFGIGALTNLEYARKAEFMRLVKVYGQAAKR